MIKHKISVYELLEVDGGGIYNNVAGYADTLTLAKEWVAKSPNWPRSFRKVAIVINVAENLKEIKRSGNNL